MPIRIFSAEDGPEQDAANILGLPDADPTVEQLPEGLSFCLIMKNEERFLQRCLASVAGIADELCVVDTGSTDRSIEIAKSFGARIETIEWPKDFAKARNVSLKMAKYRWILTLDADEEITPASLFALQEIKKAPAALTAVMCRILNKTEETDGGMATFSHYLPRLFPNTPRLRYKGAVHERLTVDDDAGAFMVDSPIVLLHYGYQSDVLIERDKTNRNLPLIEKEALENPDDTFCIFNLAMLQMSLEKSEESIGHFEHMFEVAARKNENVQRAYFAPAYITLAMQYYRSRGDYDKAMELIDKCLSISPYYPNALYFKSNMHAIKSEHEEARAALKKAVDAQEFIRAYAFVDEEICLWKAKYYLGMSYAGTHEYAEAISWLDRAIDARPGFLEIRLARARVLELMGKAVEAELEFLGITRDFDSDMALSEYLSCLMRQRRYTKVLETVTREASQRSERAQMQMYLNAALSAHRLHRFDADDYLARAVAIEKHPHAGAIIQALDETYLELDLHEEREELRAWELDSPPMCLVPHDFARRASRYIEADRYKDAHGISMAGLAGTPDNPHLLLNAAVSEAQLDMDDQAIDHLAKLDPLIDLDAFLVGTYLRALLLQRNNKVDAALDAVETVLKRRPEQLDAIFMRARLLTILDRPSDAERALTDAAQIDRGRAAIELATLFLRQGRYAEAQAIADSALIDTEVPA